MCEFFKPWRRKLGVATLAMACLFAAGWVRGSYVADELRFPITRKTAGEITSANEGCYFIYQQRLTGDDLVCRWSFAVQNEQRAYVGNFFSNIATPGKGEVDDEVGWTVNYFGFYAGSAHNKQFGRGIVVVPYWSIVLPLTLLSAWLLLSKPK